MESKMVDKAGPGTGGAYEGMTLASGERFPADGYYACVGHVNEKEDVGCRIYPVDRYGAMFLKGKKVPVQTPCMRRVYWRLNVIC
ncbi:MAG: hypothetical protein MPJ05_06910 [Nitrosopumilus sp.]|nr:hypothetical protein [Nitrosopumilus sp.]